MALLSHPGGGIRIGAARGRRGDGYLMGQSMRESNVLLLNGVGRPVAQPLSDHLRGIRLLQLSIGTGDLLVIVAATGLAALGRGSLTVFRVANDVDAVAQAIAPWIV